MRKIVQTVYSFDKTYVPSLCVVGDHSNSDNDN